MYRVAHDVDFVEHDGFRELSETVELVQFDSHHAVLVSLERALSTTNHQQPQQRSQSAALFIAIVCCSALSQLSPSSKSQILLVYGVPAGRRFVQHLQFTSPETIDRLRVPTLKAKRNEPGKKARKWRNRHLVRRKQQDVQTILRVLRRQLGDPRHLLWSGKVYNWHSDSKTAVDVLL